MKKIATVFIFLALTISFICADETPKQEGSSIAFMVKSDLFKNADKISEASKSLTQEQKLLLYSDLKKDSTGPFLLNFLIGCGVGSFVQGDTSTGWSFVVCSLIGAGMILIAPKINDSSVRAAMPFIGYELLIGTKIAECIAPFTYANKFNNKLKEALHYYDLQTSNTTGGTQASPSENTPGTSSGE